MTTLAEQIVSEACKVPFAQIPQATVARAKLFLLDTVGVALAGRYATGAESVIDLAVEMGGRAEATILGTAHKVSVPFAALANSFMAHAREFDELHERGGAHVNVCVIPAALAAAEKKGRVSGRIFLAAMIKGVDLVCRLGIAISLHPGWHTSSVFGGFGAALASGLILGMEPDVLVNALGLAYSQAAGTRQGRLEGKLAKRLQPALACKSGVMASLLAHKGITGPKEWLEGLWGIARVYGCSPEAIDVDAIAAIKSHLSQVFLGDDLSFKLYPCCKVTHTSIEAALLLTRENALNADEIEAVKVRVSRGAYSTVGHPFEPGTNPQVDAQFSIPYTVALALTRGRVTLDGFEDAAIRDPQIRRLAAKIQVEVDPEMKDASANMVNLATALTIYTQRGIFFKKLATCKGHPANPAREEELCQKFRDCAHFGQTLSQAQIEQTLQLICNLEDVEDIQELLVHLRTPA
ncbi:MAG: MmgE/PrpD family protein [Desulfobacterales bacterium]|nr:MAG: MmgE/PrpD family protein [Desulfobacterales bacterium]